LHLNSPTAIYGIINFQERHPASHLQEKAIEGRGLWQEGHLEGRAVRGQGMGMVLISMPAPTFSTSSAGQLRVMNFYSIRFIDSLHIEGL